METLSNAVHADALTIYLTSLSALCESCGPFSSCTWRAKIGNSSSREARLQWQIVTFASRIVVRHAFDAKFIRLGVLIPARWVLDLSIKRRESSIYWYGLSVLMEMRSHIQHSPKLNISNRLMVYFKSFLCWNYENLRRAFGSSDRIRTCSFWIQVFWILNT